MKKQSRKVFHPKYNPKGVEFFLAQNSSDFSEHMIDWNKIRSKVIDDLIQSFFQHFNIRLINFLLFLRNKFNYC
jgi:hypothetical protein